MMELISGKQQYFISDKDIKLSRVYLNREITSLPNEVWKPIYGYEKYYEISSIGRWKGKERKYYTGWRKSQLMVKPERIMKASLNRGYLMTSLVDDNGRETKKAIHVLVAEHFLEPRPNWAEVVDHISTLKTQNNFENLRWATRSENTVYAHDAGIIGNWYKAKFTKEEVLKIFNDTRTIDELAVEHNVHRSTIHLIRVGKNYSRYTGKKYERKICQKQ